ncbi:hypothetical protein VTO73DRAFT_14306 [Trametes versicolor]
MTSSTDSPTVIASLAVSVGHVTVARLQRWQTPRTRSRLWPCPFRSGGDRSTYDVPRLAGLTRPDPWVRRRTLARASALGAVALLLRTMRRRTSLRGRGLTRKGWAGRSTGLARTARHPLSFTFVGLRSDESERPRHPVLCCCLRLCCRVVVVGVGALSNLLPQRGVLIYLRECE